MARVCDYNEIFRICAALKGLGPENIASGEAAEIAEVSWRIFVAGVPPAWERPSGIEAEVDGIIRDIRRLKKRIGALDSFAKSSARREADRSEREKIEREMGEAAVSGNRNALSDALQRYREISARARETWVDIAALAKLDELEAALRAPAAMAISAAGTGAGRKRNRQAYHLALAAARAFKRLTGNEPTFWNGGETPFSRMLSEVYRCAGVTADMRTPVEAAMRELREES